MLVAASSAAYAKRSASSRAECSSGAQTLSDANGFLKTKEATQDWWFDPQISLKFPRSHKCQSCASRAYQNTLSALASASRTCPVARVGETNRSVVLDEGVSTV